MRIRTVVMLAPILMTLGGASAAQDRATEALDGTDPVLLVQGKDVLGKPEFRAVHEGFEYMFASAATKAEFEKNPAKYAIQFGGLCARMGRTASGNMSDYVVHEGKIYVFGSDSCHKLFVATPAKYLPPAEEPMPADRAARERGRRLLDGAAAAVGAKRLDSLTSYAEGVSQVLKRGETNVPVSIKAMWRFPDAVRVERSMTMGERVMSSATLATPEGAWFQAQGQSYPMIAAARANAVAEQRRQLVPLLRARHERDVVAAALGRGTAAGMDVERVRVRRGKLDVVLGLDPVSGRPRSLTFTDRNGEGEFGTYTIVYDGYRTMEGLNVPFDVRGTFNGRPEPSQSWTVASIQANPAIDASLFVPAARR